MAAHGSLEPFVLVRVQVGELEGDMRRHVIMSPHIFYQIRSAIWNLRRMDCRISRRWPNECGVLRLRSPWRLCRHTGFPACLRLRGSPACRSKSMAFRSCALRFISRLRGSLHNLLPAIGICSHLQCGIGKHHNAAVENHRIRRTGIPGRDAPGRCRTVPRRNRLRTRRGWRWLATARWKGRSGRPSASLPESERYQ